MEMRQTNELEPLDDEHDWNDDVDEDLDEDFEDDMDDEDFEDLDGEW